jgi:formylglycine-generating enzyme required for sulfatase activity
MKKLLFLLPACLLFLAFTNQSKDPEFDAKKEMVALPSGIWMSKFEVSQARYKQFLADVPKEKLQEMRPDSTVWLTELFNDPYAKYYFQHTAFASYPVVGISHVAASAFCDWMTEKYGKQIKLKSADGEVAAGYRFRLPTEAEWTAAASAGKYHSTSYPGGFHYPRDHRGRWVFNHKVGKGDFAGYAGGNGKDYEGYMITAPVKSYLVDPSGFYNLTGNVAEMVAEYGVAKGGSWYHRSDDCKIESVNTYEKPMSWLGFRIVVEAMDIANTES